jgi:hypothetical protein
VTLNLGREVTELSQNVTNVTVGLGSQIVKKVSRINLRPQNVNQVCKCLHYRSVNLPISGKALQNWEIFVSALSKRLWELTKLTKQSRL